MSRKKILSVVGARPQFIKLAPLSKRIRGKFDELIVHTGQHYDKEMSELIFGDLQIPKPDFNLGIGGGNHGEQTGKTLIELEKVLVDVKPDLVVVFGDTNATLAGALAGAKQAIKTLHIEAGLRSYNRTMPEEINRVVADHTSDYLFAPTDTAISNLKKEGLEDKSYLVGDIMVDSLQHNLQIAEQKSDILKMHDITGRYFVLTLHRPYNVDDPDNLSLLLNKLGELETRIVFPVHPRTKRIIEENNISVPENILTTKPLGYLDFLKIQNGADKILTDSGGIQKEAYILKKPCITLRPETEWVETVDEGWNMLADVRSNNFIEKVVSFSSPSKQKSVFGENVTQKMISVIEEIL